MQATARLQKQMTGQRVTHPDGACARCLASNVCTLDCDAFAQSCAPMRRAFWPERLPPGLQVPISRLRLRVDP